MDKNKIKVLNSYHVIFLVQNVMVGVSVLSLPHSLSAMGYSQWWMPLLFGIIANILIIPMIWLGMKYPDDSLFVIHEKLLGKWLGKTFNGFLVIYFTIVVSAVCSKYLQLIQVVALVDRPITGPLIVFLLLLTYIVSGGIKSIARFCIIAFFFTIGLVYYLKWAVIAGDIRHLLPLFNFETKELISATAKGLMAIGGFELISFYFPNIINQKKAFKHASVGIWISVFYILSFTIVSVMYFSDWSLKNQLYPVLGLFKEVELSFLERIDVLAMAMFVVLILSTTAAYLWVAKRGIDSIRSTSKMVHLYIITVLVFIIVQFPFMEEYQEKIFDRTFYVMYTLFIWPTILCLLHVIKPKKRRELVE